MGELGINLPSLLAQLVNFGILLGILYLVAYKPIMKMLDERASRIKESMEQTEVIKDKAEKAEEEIAEQLKEAGRQSQAVIDRGVRTGEEMRQKAQEEVKKEAEALLARARNEIRRERDGVIDDLRREFAGLTILAAGKVIDRTLDKEAHRQLIDKVLEEGTELKKGG
ncbi:MAG: F0F1 ATP synthase subunit B [Dehalococcoidales bacterium]